MNTTDFESNDNDHKSMVYLELVAVFYIVGILGSFLALLHLYCKRNFKNTKQAFMLKLVLNEIREEGLN